MSRYKAYPAYKDSGVEWVGEIPEDWDMWKIFHACPSIGSGTTPKSDSDDYYGGDIPWITTGELREGIVFQTQKKVTEKALIDIPTLRLHPKGSVAIAMYGATIGRLGILGNDATTNQACCVMPPSEVLHGKYLFYWLHANRQEIINLSSGGGQPNVSQEKIASLKVSAPNNLLQEKIAAFLDHETAKIDALIEKQQRLIELLKEKRQAVISHAVTKGLNPNAPMKDSGVEWLGEVPAHWVVRRLKHSASLQSGIPKGKDLTGKVTIEVPMLRVANVQDGYLDLSEVDSIQIEPSELGRYALKYGDVLMNEGGDNDKLGRGAVWKSEITPCIHQNHVFSIRPADIEPDWLDLVTRASYAKYHFYRVAKQSTNLASISSTNIKETPLVIPPKQERKQISSHINEQLRKFDLLENNANVQIELLQERRTALISAAVTGKIDVRDWQPAAA
ncbi:MAG: hypothetical protein F9K30_01070 [Dechloromonas sp.]|nr:MAG: hypothetical protein F9K30_01070 [Dechloromonas sp.]